MNEKEAGDSPFKIFCQYDDARLVIYNRKVFKRLSDRWLVINYKIFPTSTGRA